MMDREEAIELLDDLIGFIEDNQGRDYDGALRMAIEALSVDRYTEQDVRDAFTDGYGCGIEALSAEPTVEKCGNTQFSKPTDTISRAEVSAWLSNMGHDKLASAVMDTRRFPSADRPSGECEHCVYKWDMRSSDKDV